MELVLIIKDTDEQPIFTLILNSVESFKSCLEFLKHKSFANEVANTNFNAPNASLLNPASAIVHNFDNYVHSRTVIPTEPAQKDDSICHTACRRITNLFT